MKTTWGMIVLAALTLGSTAEAGGCAPDLFDVADAARASNAFAVDLYRQVARDDGNLFFSPSSLTTALAMTYAGARGGTAAEMARVLHWPDRQDAVHVACSELLSAWEPPEGAPYRLSVANRLWGQTGFNLRPEFLDLVRERYRGGFAPQDFAANAEDARLSINAWIRERTEDRIHDLLRPGSIDASTRLVLTNAIYFLGTWRHAFEPRATTDEPFHLAGNNTVMVPMMRQVERLRLGVHEGVHVLELPYAGDDLSMFVLLPDAPDGLADLERRLAPSTLEAWLDGAALERVRCVLPRFSVTASFDLGETLEGMGMASAFDGARADFSGMTGGKDLAISEVVHKAFVDVDEAGTEAAAATAVTMKLTSVSHEAPPIDFVADHPFLFLIRHRETGAILFLGRLTDPRAS